MKSKIKDISLHVAIWFLAILTATCMIYTTLIINWNLLDEWLAYFKL